MLQEGQQHVVFRARKIDGDAIGRPKLPPRHVQRPTRKGHPARAGVELAALLRCRAPQQGAHARDQLPGRERLGDVIISAQFEAEHPIHLLAACGQHHHRCPAAFAEAAQKVQAGSTGQHHIEQYQVRLAARSVEYFPHLTGIAGGGNAEPCLAQKAADERAHLAVILHDQQVGLRVEQPALRGIAHRFINPRG